MSFAYDQPAGQTGCSSSHPVGRLTRMTDPTGQTTYCHDRHGNILLKQQLVDGHGVEVGYRYDLAGRVLALVYPGGDEARYSRNAIGQITGISYAKKQADGSFVETPVVAATTHEPFGPITSIDYHGGATWQAEYDANYWPQSITGTALALHLGTCQATPAFTHYGDTYLYAPVRG